MSKISFCFYVYLVNWCAGEDSNVTKPYFRILAPQFICEDKNAIKDDAIKVPNVISILLQPIGGQRLRYDCVVQPRVIGGPRNQWFNMRVWRSSRGLEKYIKDKRDIITATNVFDIENAKLTAGVDYSFNMTAVNVEGVVSDPRTFKIRFTDASNRAQVSLGADGSNEEVSIVLVGADITYADSEYILEAQVTYCVPSNDYQFSWTVLDSAGSKLPIGGSGKLLKIPPNMLKTGQLYPIKCVVLNSKDGNKVTETDLMLMVLSRNLQIDLNFDDVIVGIDQVVLFETNVVKSSTEDILSYEWNCLKLPEKSPCADFQTSNSAALTTSLSTLGNHEITVKVSDGKKTAQRTSRVSVKNGLIPTIAVKSTRVPHLAVAEGTELKMESTVGNLKPGCELKWRIIKENGFEYFNEDDVPGGLGNLTVYSMEDGFLLELSEFGNDTYDRDFDLYIPSKSATFAGLLGDVKYKTRLEVKCKCVPKIENCDEGESESDKNDSHIDIVIETNAAPKITNVTITPPEGIALRTIFKISTPTAQDIQSDYPLKYTFTYKILEAQYILTTSYENYFADTTLPYSDSPITPSVTVCDSRGACATKDGLSVKTSPPLNMTDQEFSFLVGFYVAATSRGDYDQARTSLNAYLRTFTASPDFYKKLVDIATRTTRTETAKLRGMIKKNAVDKNTVQTFVNFSKEFLTSTKETPDDVVQGLIDLLNDVINSKSRRKRSISKRPRRSVTPEMVQTALELSELIINSPNETVVRSEERNLPNKVDVLMSNLCSEKADYEFDTKIASLSVQTINLQQKSKTFQPIPFKLKPNKKYNLNESSIASLQIVPGPSPSNVAWNRLCVGKVVFPRDYLVGNMKNDETPQREIYEVKLFQTNGIAVETAGDLIVVLRIPIPAILANDIGNLTCGVRVSNSWSTDRCTKERTVKAQIGTYLQCSCNILGYFKVVTRETSITDPTTTKSSENLSTQIGYTENISSSSETIAIQVAKNGLTSITPTETVVTSISSTEKELTLLSPTEKVVTIIIPNDKSTPPTEKGVAIIFPNDKSTPPTEKRNPINFPTEKVVPIIFPTDARVSPPSPKVSADRAVQMAAPSNDGEGYGPVPPYVKFQMQYYVFKYFPVNKNDLGSSKSNTPNTIVTVSSANTQIAILTLLCLLGFGALGAFFILKNLRRRRLHNVRSNDKQTDVVLMDNSRIGSASLKYRRFHDENLMEGIIENTVSVVGNIVKEASPQVQDEYNKKNFEFETTKLHNIAYDIPNTPTANN